MPLITIEYDNNEVLEPEIQELSQAIQKIVSSATDIKDVFVYTNTAHIKVSIAPIEIFVRMSANKIKNEDDLVGEIKVKLKEWKVSVDFKHPINLTLIPMNWRIEIGI